MRGFYEDLDREREKDAEIERLRSSQSERIPGGGMGVAAAHKGRAALHARGVGSAPVEEEETSLFLTDEWMQELQSVGKGDSGATTAYLMGQRTARLHRSTESSLWHRCDRVRESASEREARARQSKKESTKGESERERAREREHARAIGSSSCLSEEK